MMRLILFFVIMACGNASNTPELVDKLRTLGVKTSPLIITPQESAEDPQTAAIQLFAMIPKSSEKIEVLSYAGDLGGTKFPLPFELPVLTKQEDVGPLQLLTFETTLPIPSTSLVEASLLQSDFVGFRYGVTIKSGADQEHILATFLVHKKDNEKKEWKPIEANILEPKDGDKVSSSKVTLKGEIVQKNEENYKVGWFVSSGTVARRRSLLSAEVSSLKAGEQTIVLTVRGRKTGDFSIKTIKVIVE